MKRAEKAARIVEILDRLYPETPVPLDHSDPYTLLVAVMLSAQTTDKKVNQITPALFEQGGTPEKMAKLSVETITALIREVGLAPTKARNLKTLSRMLVELHGAVVPDDFVALEALPGIGHKTASVVLAQAFGVPTFPVDTHIHRLGIRWGLTGGKNVKTTEADLKKIFDRGLWNKLHLQIIFFGREYCQARRHDLSACPICGWAATKKQMTTEALRDRPKRRLGKGAAVAKKR